MPYQHVQQVLNVNVSPNQVRRLAKFCNQHFNDHAFPNTSLVVSPTVIVAVLPCNQRHRRHEFDRACALLAQAVARSFPELGDPATPDRPETDPAVKIFGS